MNHDNGNMKILFLALVPSFLPLAMHAYEAMYDKTPVGKIEIKEIAQRIALEASVQSPYFGGNNNLFRTLFRYISNNGVAMTVPVEAEMQPGKMRFFVGAKDANKKLLSIDDVEVRNLEPITVISIGIRGSYSEKRFKKNEKALLEWLAENGQYEAVSNPYGVYWNSPFVPGFLKRSEIHLPVKEKPVDPEPDKASSKESPNPDKS